MRLRIGILETGAPPADLELRFGSYGSMFQRILGQSYDYSRFDVRQGEYPQAGDCDTYLVTGSAAGVHDGDSWIQNLKSFLRDAAGHVPMVGVCFGHQIMAEAFGGNVVTSAKGWGIGLHRYQMQHRAAWMDEARAIAFPASHRDQISAIPEGAVVLAASEFTPFAVVHYPSRKALSFQGHPEFSAEFAAALIETRRGAIYSAAQADEAVASLQGVHEGRRAALWIKRFIARTIRREAL